MGNLIQSALRATMWALPLLAIYAAWLLGAAIIYSDISIFYNEIIRGCTRGLAPCGDGFTTAWSLFTPIYRGLREFALFVGFAIITTVAVHSELLRRRISLCVNVIGTVCVCVILLQLIGVVAHGTTSQDHFWQGVDRISGVFSDPNAFGISSFLLIGLALSAIEPGKKWRSITFIILALLWFIVSLFSGSRSLFIGLAVAMFAYTYECKRRVFYALVLFIVAFILALQFVELHGIGGVPPGIARLIESLQFAHIRSALFSREVFWIVALSLWLSSPIIGIGFNRFEYEFPETAQSLGYSLQGWVDNPNSFYLGILSELGLLGITALVFAVIAFRWRGRENLSARSFVIGFLVLLLFGPHLDYPEVVLLAPLLIGNACSLREISLSRYMKFFFLAASLFLCVTSALRTTTGQYGIWGSLTSWPPRDPWVGKDAAYSLSCTNSKARVTFHVPFAQFASSPVAIQLRSELGEEHSLTISSSDRVTTEFRCVKDPLDPNRWLPVRVLSQCSRYWIPERLGIGKDRRPLCYQILR